MATPTDIARQAEQLNEVDWFDFLNELDDVARRRRQNPPPEPDGSNRDTVAAWIANLHFIGDNKVREIWFLPLNSDPDEIRLIEVNERVGEGFGPTPQIFGEEVGGRSFKLKVVDMTGDELESARRDPRQLPASWTFDGALVWRRGE